MKTVQAIIDSRGGLEALKKQYLRIENPPYMRLVIEYIGTGPYGGPAVSVAHYYEQNGDAMRDPEMTFELAEKDGLTLWIPLTYQQDNLGMYQVAVERGADGQQVFVRPKLVKDLESFARMWDRNIKDQGFMNPGRRMNNNGMR